MDDYSRQQRGDKSLTCVLVEMIVQLAAFLEFSDNETVDPDSSTRELDELCANLEQLTQAERTEFIECLKRLAAERIELNKQAAPFVIPGTEKYVRFLENFPTDFGLVDDRGM
jgi:hypothetical protein